VVVKGSCFGYGGRSCHGSPVVADQASSFNKLFQRASGRWKVFAARGGVSTNQMFHFAIVRSRKGVDSGVCCVNRPGAGVLVC